MQTEGEIWRAIAKASLTVHCKNEQWECRSSDNVVCYGDTAEEMLQKAKDWMLARLGPRLEVIGVFNLGFGPDFEKITVIDHMPIRDAQRIAEQKAKEFFAEKYGKDKNKLYLGAQVRPIKS